DRLNIGASAINTKMDRQLGEGASLSSYLLALTIDLNQIVFDQIAFLPSARRGRQNFSAHSNREITVMVGDPTPGVHPLAVMDDLRSQVLRDHDPLFAMSHGQSQ